jgi:hypothetical protein
MRAPLRPYGFLQSHAAGRYLLERPDVSRGDADPGIPGFCGGLERRACGVRPHSVLRDEAAHYVRPTPVIFDFGAPQVGFPLCP